MQPINHILDLTRNNIKRFMTVLAKDLNTVSKGRIKPSHVTLFGLGMHVLIAWLIAMGYHILAALLLVIFGLFDAIDGALARLQDKASNSGMLLDASTDRMKEVLLYVAIAYYLLGTDQAFWSPWAVAALGSSILVSYIKAKGETAVAGKLPANEANRLFQDGLMRFEIRMALLFAGLLLDLLAPALVVITVGSTATAIGRLINISKKLDA